MKMKVLLIAFLFIAGLFAIAPGSVSAELDPADYSITKYDPKDDVLLMRSGGDFKFDSWDNVEVSKIESRYIEGSNPITDPDEIELKMTVEGTIQNSEDYKYVFVVTANGEEYIFAAYYQDKAWGWKLDSPTPYATGVSATGEGTDTLTITFKKDHLGTVNSYDFSAGAVYSQGDYLRYVDFVPDKLVLITEPSDRSTLDGSGTFTIKGVVRESIDNVPAGTLEVKVDETSQTVSGWDDWQATFDTGPLSEGEHTISVEIVGAGVDNAEDEIRFTIDRDTGNYPFFNQNPVVRVGDEYFYKSIGTAEIVGIPMDVTNEMQTKVEDVETVEGEEVYRVWAYSEGSQDLGYVTYENSVDRTSWRKTSDPTMFGTVKERTVTTIEVDPFRPETTIDTTTTFSPPLEIHNDFEVTVGWDNQWHFQRNSESESTTTVAGEGTTQNPDYSENMQGTGECLFYQSSLSIPGGDTFDNIYAIRNYYENPGVSIIEYYSPELGVPVKIETYDPSRNLLFSLGLDEYQQASVIIDGIFFDPELPKAKGDNKVTVTVKNVGADEAQNIKVTLYDDGSQVEQKTVSSVQSGDSEDVTFDWSPSSEGNHTIRVVLTHDNDDVDEKTAYIVVDPAEPGDEVPWVLLIIFIVIVIAIILAFIMLKRRGTGEEVKKEEEGEEKPEEGEEAEAAEVETEEAEGVVVVGEGEEEEAEEEDEEEEEAEEDEEEEAEEDEEPDLLTETIQCPSCKNEFTVQFESKPVKVKCPDCGTEGVLK